MPAAAAETGRADVRLLASNLYLLASERHCISVVGIPCTIQFTGADAEL